MALSAVNKTFERVSNPNREPEVQNDLLLVVKKDSSKGKDSDAVKDVFRISDKMFEETGLKTKEKGALILSDDEVQEVYLAVVDNSSAKAFKAREKFDKTNEFQYKDAVDLLVKYGSVDENRVLNHYFGFDLVSKPEMVSAVEGLGYKGCTFVFVVTKADVIGRAASYAVNVEKPAKTTASVEGETVDTNTTSDEEEVTEQADAVAETAPWED